LQTFGKVIPVAAVFLAAGFFVAAAPEPAQAQLFQWGTWGNPGAFQPKPRVRRRAPRIEEDNEKIVSTLPKPSGPLVLVVSIGKQTVTVYDNGKELAKSPISSGMPGHDSPTGIFSILEKNRYHYSNLYGGAPMPFMQRVTNSGVAMHAGELPGYPASHGCIRLPYSFARNLFGITDIGARVIITNDDPTPAEFNSPHLIGPLPPDTSAQNGTGVTTASASEGELSSVLGVSPAAAEEAGKVRTRGMAAASRASDRERLVNAITAAQGAQVAANDQAKAATAAAQDGKEQIRKERGEQDRLEDAARKAAKDEAAARNRFVELTSKMAKVDATKLDPAELEKQSAEELAEEAKVLDLADATRAARKLAAQQAEKAKRSVAEADALDKARKVAVEDAKNAATAVDDAKAALVASDTIDARRDSPVSIFISSKTGRLTAKLGFVQVIDVPVTIADAGKPLGTHVLTATAYTDGEKNLRWNSVTLKAADSSAPPRRRKRRHDDEAFVPRAPHDADAASAIERIQIPKETADKLAELMKPGSSYIISDYGLSRETSNRTEFIVEPWRSRPDSGAEVQYY
jgi:lipoprotein-anchoring transpeptidase ErfK/SrfK